MLYQGRVRWQGTIEEIKATTDPLVRQFVEGKPTVDDPSVAGGATNAFPLPHAGA
jgi:phospholipid/cholesterol/gamma-HCH transport system ATP-binding protein